MPEERLRHHSLDRKAHATRRRNEVSSTGQPSSLQNRPEAGLSLLPFSVSRKTALTCYIPNVWRFLEFDLLLDLPVLSREEIDNSVLTYLDRLVEDEEVGPH